MPSPLCVAGGGSNEIVSITTTVDQTAVTEQTHAIMTILANSVSVGTTWRIRVWGNVDNGTTAITFTPRLRWVTSGSAPSTGVALLATPTFANSTTLNTNRAIFIEAAVTIRTVGATGSAVAAISYTERSTSTTGVETDHTDNSGVTAVTIDTTAAKDLVLSWTLSATTGTPHMRTIGGWIELVKA
jgi:hypothetical protein